MTSLEPEPPPGALTVGEVARLVGVTARTLRHYHAVGLLPEPPRDGSGYRRYGAGDVVAAVRVVRLRALGMPIPQVADQVGSDHSPGQLDAALHALADDLDREIDRLAAMRDRVRELAGSETRDQPVDRLRAVLTSVGALTGGADLPAGEEAAAALVDALHPQGISGALDQAEDLLSDPARRAALGELLIRFRSLSDDPPATDAEIEALARDVAAALPRPEGAAPPVDVAVMDKLLGDRLTDSQRRFMVRLRQLTDGNGE